MWSKSAQYDHEESLCHEYRKCDAARMNTACCTQIHQQRKPRLESFPSISCCSTVVEKRHATDKPWGIATCTTQVANRASRRSNAEVRTEIQSCCFYRKSLLVLWVIVSSEILIPFPHDCKLCIKPLSQRQNIRCDWWQSMTPTNSLQLEPCHDLFQPDDAMWYAVIVISF